MKNKTILVGLMVLVVGCNIPNLNSKPITGKSVVTSTTKPTTQPYKVQSTINQGVIVATDGVYVIPKIASYKFLFADDVKTRAQAFYDESSEFKRGCVIMTIECFEELMDAIPPEKLKGK